MVKRNVVIINLSMHRPVLFHFLLDWHIGGSWLKVDRFRFNKLMLMWLMVMNLMAMRFMVMRFMVVRFMDMRFIVNRVMGWRNIDGFKSMLMGRTWNHVPRRMCRDGRQRDVVVVFGVGLVVDDGVVVVREQLRSVDDVERGLGRVVRGRRRRRRRRRWRWVRVVRWESVGVDSPGVDSSVEFVGF